MPAAYYRIQNIYVATRVASRYDGMDSGYWIIKSVKQQRRHYKAIAYTAIA